MIHCSAFCIFIGEGASDLLVEGIRNVDRQREVVLVDTGAGFEELTERVPKSRRAAAVFALDGGDKRLPAVHGFYTGADDYPMGEFSFLDSSGEDIIVGRDRVGTRPLFYHAGSTIAAASDHRLLRGLEGGRLLEPGESVNLADGATKSHPLPTTQSPKSREEAANVLLQRLDASVKMRTRGKRRVAVSFSGGLDSSIVAHCASKYADVILCSVFARGSRDERSAREAAEALGLKMVGVEAREEDVRRELQSMDLNFSPSSMDRALWAIYSISARLARMNGAETILLGQLADELFGGYVKYERAQAVKGGSQAQRMMAEDIARCGREGLIRDEQACSRWIEPAFPFTDESIVALGLAVPPEMKIAHGERKAILRDAARNLDLPESIVEAPKKAAQYSSGVLRLVAQ